MIIKADQFRSWHQQFVDKTLGIATLLSSAANMRSADTVRDFSERLVRTHRPSDPLELPDFMAPREQSPTSQTARTIHAEGPSAVSAEIPAKVEPKKLICVTCGSKITYAEGKFCWNNALRFGGLQYCRDHQVGNS